MELGPDYNKRKITWLSEVPGGRREMGCTRGRTILVSVVLAIEEGRPPLGTNFGFVFVVHAGVELARPKVFKGA